jgi:hypothetical protein
MLQDLTGKSSAHPIQLTRPFSGRFSTSGSKSAGPLAILHPRMGDPRGLCFRNPGSVTAIDVKGIILC